MAKMKIKATARKSTSQSTYGKNLSMLLQRTLWDISDDEDEIEDSSTIMEIISTPLIRPKLEIKRCDSASDCDREADTECNSPISENLSTSDGGENSDYFSGSTFFSQAGNASSTSGDGDQDVVSSSELSQNEGISSASSESEMDSSDDEDLPSTLTMVQEEFFGRKKVLQVMAVQHKAKRKLLKTGALDATKVFALWQQQEAQLFKVSCEGINYDLTSVERYLMNLLIDFRY